MLEDQNEENVWENLIELCIYFRDLYGNCRGQKTEDPLDHNQFNVSTIATHVGKLNCKLSKITRTGNTAI